MSGVGAPDAAVNLPSLPPPRVAQYPSLRLYLTDVPQLYPILAILKKYGPPLEGSVGGIGNDGDEGVKRRITLHVFGLTYLAFHAVSPISN